MDSEFHYYLTYFLAREAELPEHHARILSCASSYPDNALVAYRILTDRGEYRSLATHHLGFWDKSQEWESWIPFHFVPGDPHVSAGRRRDGRVHPLAVSENGRHVRTLLIEALKTRNLYRVGVALHAFADSYAHQDFTGTRDDFNSTGSRSLIPPIGHAQYLSSPDKFEEVWTDERLISSAATIRNRERFLRAAAKIFGYLWLFRHGGRSIHEDKRAFAMERIRWILDDLGADAGRADRLLHWQLEESIPAYDRNAWKNEAIVTSKLPEDVDLASAYDKLLWIKNEFLHKTRIIAEQPVPARPGFHESHFYKWMKAAASHKKLALSVLSKLKTETAGRA